MLTVLSIVAAAVVAGGAFVISRATRSTAVFCPRHETLVDIRDGVCLAQADGRALGSAWTCPRECLHGREADARRTAAAPTV